MEAIEIAAECAFPKQVTQRMQMEFILPETAEGFQKETLLNRQSRSQPESV